MTDSEALLEVRRALGCPEWTDNDRIVGLTRDIVRAVEIVFSLNCMILGPSNEQFMLCPTLTRLQEMEADLEMRIADEQGEGA